MVFDSDDVGVHLHLRINMTFEKRVLNYTLWQTVIFCPKKNYLEKSKKFFQIQTKNK